MYKSNDKRYTVPMKNAEASVRMEGCQVMARYYMLQIISSM